jgi:hypothetical protein
MKTLYDKLKPEFKQKLESEAANYPSLVDNVVNSLKNNYFWSNLSIGQARDFIYFTDYSLASLSSYDWSYGEKFICED